MKALRRVAYAIALPIILVAIWWLVTASGENFFFPTPAVIAQAFEETWIGDRFALDFVPSVGRLALGLAAAIVIGVGLGLLIGSIRWLRYLTEPALEFFRAIPPPVLIPVLLLVLGITDETKIVVIAAGCVWPVLLNTIEGVRAVDPVVDDTARVFQTPGWRRIIRVVLPAASPQIMTGVRQSLSIGLILMVVSEMFASTSGLGFAIVRFQRSFAIPEMWSGIVILGLLGVALSILFHFAERAVLRWYHGLREVEHAL